MVGVESCSFLIFGGVHDEYTLDSLLSDFRHLCSYSTGLWQQVALPKPKPAGAQIDWNPTLN
jgi:hypothetical protein